MEPAIISTIDRLNNMGLFNENTDLKKSTEIQVSDTPQKKLIEPNGSVEDRGKNITDRKTNRLDEPAVDSLEPDKKTQDCAESIPVDVGVLTGHQVQNKKRSFYTINDPVLDPFLLQQQLEEINNQINLLINCYGEFPVAKNARYKLVALYVNENVLQRMLYGALSDCEYAGLICSIGRLLPDSQYGKACREVLDLWKLPGNEKYYFEGGYEYIERIVSPSEEMKRTTKRVRGRNYFLIDKMFAMQSERLSSISGVRNHSSCDHDGSQVVETFTAGEPNNSENESAKHLSEAEQQSLRLTRVDQMVIVFFHLYQEFNDGVRPGAINVINVDILHNYYEQFMSETCLTSYDKGVVSFVFFQTLSHFYHRLCLECSGQGSCYLATKSRELRRVNMVEARRYKNILHAMVIASIEKDVIVFSDTTILYLAVSGFLLNYRDKVAEKSQLNRLSSVFAHSAKQDAEYAFAKYMCISVAEIMGDVETFERIAEDSSKYNTLALLTIIWNDLGFSRWPYSSTLNPEKSFEYLEFIQDEMADQESYEFKVMKDSMDMSYKMISGLQDKITLGFQLAEKIALYFYIYGEPLKASEILKFSKCNNKTYYLGLAMISRRKYELAIGFLEKGKNRDMRINALLGVLYEKLINRESEQHPKYAQWMQSAEINYQAVVKSRPEMNKNMARLLENRGDFLNALAKWKDYRTFLHGRSKVAGLRPVRFKIPLELQLVNEKITELEKKVAVNEIDQSGLPHSGGLTTVPSSGTAIAEPGSVSRVNIKQRVGKKRLSRNVVPETGQKNKSTEGKKEAVYYLPMPASRSDQSNEEVSGQGRHGISQEPERTETQWQVVTCKRMPVHAPPFANKWDIPPDFSVEEVKHHWELTRSLRNNLTNRLLNFDFDGGDFDGVFALIDQYLSDIQNPVARLHFIQNKEWLLRCKSFEKRVLYLQSNLSGKSPQKIKAELRLAVLNTVQQQVANIYRLGCSCEASPHWFADPSRLQTEQMARLKEKAHPEFGVQLGAQLSTAAHVMKDIYYEFSPHREDNYELCQTLYGRLPGYFQALAVGFFSVRDYFDPWHKSDVFA